MSVETALGVMVLLRGGPLNGVSYELPANFTFEMKLRIRREGTYTLSLDTEGRLIATWEEAW